MTHRNNIVDIIRGFAMLLVVLGHTISGSTVEYEVTFLFQLIWTLQMPLFIIVSGYVTRYSKPIDSAGKLWGYVRKRTLAYLLPWAVWTFFVRGLLFHQTAFFNLKYLFWHMDTGYWFLITIWTINMLYLCADYLSNKITMKAGANLLWHLVFCICGMAALAVVGYLAGFSFFSIKLTLYYIPFYLLGFLYGRLQERVLSYKNGPQLLEVAVAVSLAAWIGLITRFDFFTASGAVMVGLRFVTSVLGCCAVIGLFTAYRRNLGGGIFLWAGEHSLEIYLMHYLFLNLFHLQSEAEIMSMNGLLLMAVNYAAAILLTVVTVKLVQRNQVLNYMLYAKRKLLHS